LKLSKIIIIKASYYHDTWSNFPNIDKDYINCRSRIVQLNERYAGGACHKNFREISPENKHQNL
jgi:hypothetical protein